MKMTNPSRDYVDSVKHDTTKVAQVLKQEVNVYGNLYANRNQKMATVIIRNTLYWDGSVLSNYADSNNLNGVYSHQQATIWSLNKIERRTIKFF
jgi:hypothetical protein